MSAREQVNVTATAENVVATADNVLATAKNTIVCRCEMYGDMQALFQHQPIDHMAKASLPPPALMHELYKDHSNVVDAVLGTLAKKTRLPDGTKEREQVRAASC
jgi:hypothetical protein